MKKSIYSVLLSTIILLSCNTNDEQAKNGSPLKKGKGGVYYGGTFRLNETIDFKSLYPLSLTMSQESRMIQQMYEGLLKLSQKDLSILPALAEKWKVNEDATSYTFYIRKGVQFHDNNCFEDGKGREVKSADFKYCLDKICEASPNNYMYWLFKDKVKGANEYYKSTANKQPLAGGVEGIKVIDDYTIQIDLNYPFAGFANIISHPSCSVYPKEAIDAYGVDMRINCVGTGPFRLKKIKESEILILDRNPNYWDKDEHGNELPYLDGIKFSFHKEKKIELFEFKKGNLDMIFRLPGEMISLVVGELKDIEKNKNTSYIMQVVPALNLFYLGFQHQLPPFDNTDVRRAFNYAIDKESIITYTLQGEGRPALHGVIPPFKGYNIENVKGHEYSPEKGKEHLTKAGYKNGQGFPEVILQVNPGGSDKNVRIAEVVQKMLKENLNISVKIEQMQFAQHLETIQTGKVLFWRAGWTADYPDPETFLNILHGQHIPKDLSTKSYLNAMRYQNPKFDSTVDLAYREVDKAKRYELYRQADQIQMNDAAVIPILYGENTRLLQKYVKNFSSNAMEYRDFSTVYFEPKKMKKEVLVN